MIATIVSLAALAAVATIPVLQAMFYTTAMSTENWAIAILLSMPALAIPLLEKALQRIPMTFGSKKTMRKVFK